jgi:ADP-heptose:LPS heptosyltransferase
MNHGAEQLSSFVERWPVTDFGSMTFCETAALVSNLDYVIACDSLIAHLAGALGKTVWVALSYAPDWRWLLDRADTPWYGSMRLYRRRSGRDWRSVFERMAGALIAEFQRGKSIDTPAVS